MKISFLQLIGVNSHIFGYDATMIVVIMNGREVNKKLSLMQTTCKSRPFSGTGLEAIQALLYHALGGFGASHSVFAIFWSLFNFFELPEVLYLPTFFLVNDFPAIRLCCFSEYLQHFASCFIIHQNRRRKIQYSKVSCRASQIGQMEN